MRCIRDVGTRVFAPASPAFLFGVSANRHETRKKMELDVLRTCAEEMIDCRDEDRRLADLAPALARTKGERKETGRAKTCSHVSVGNPEGKNDGMRRWKADSWMTWQLRWPSRTRVLASSFVLDLISQNKSACMLVAIVRVYVCMFFCQISYCCCWLVVRIDRACTHEGSSHPLCVAEREQFSACLHHSTKKKEDAFCVLVRRDESFNVGVDQRRFFTVWYVWCRHPGVSLLAATSPQMILVSVDDRPQTTRRFRFTFLTRLQYVQHTG